MFPKGYSDEVTGWGDADIVVREGGEDPSAVLAAQNAPLQQGFEASEPSPASAESALSVGAIVGIAIGGAVRIIVLWPYW